MAESIEKTINIMVHELIQKAEDMFGERTIGYTLLGVEFREVPYPYLDRSDVDNKNMRIILTANSSLDLPEACFQCAHEVVHLLSPLHEGEPTVLEEGVATYFQAIIARDWFQIGFRPQRNEYDDAWTLVDPLLKLDQESIKKLRMIQPVISNITKEMIVKTYPDLPEETAEKLAMPLVHN